MENIQEKIFVHFYNMTMMFVLRSSALLCSLMEVTDKFSFAKDLSKNVDAIDSSGSMDGLIGCKILLRMLQCRRCKWHFNNTTYRNGFFKLAIRKSMNFYSCNIYFRRVLWAYYIPIWLWINFCRYCSAATGLDIL